MLETHSPESYWKVAAFLYTNTLPDSMEESVLVNFVSTLALADPVTGKYKTASIFTPDLSRLIYGFKKCWGCTQLTWIEFHISTLTGPEPTGAIKSKDQYRQEVLRDRHRRDFEPQSLFSCAWRWLDALRAYGQGFAINEEGIGCIMWAPDHKYLRVKEHTVHLHTMSALMKKAVAEMERTLKALTDLAQVPLAPRDLPLVRLVDDATWSEPGAWFGAHPANEGLLTPEAFGDVIISRYLKRKDQTSASNLELTADNNGMDDLFAVESKFLRAALLAIFMTSGMPCRGQELVEATTKDTAGARPRSFILGADEEVYMHLTYNKSEWSSSRSKHNLRLLVPIVGRMWIFYLGQIRPGLDLLYRHRFHADRTFAFSSANAKGEIAQWRGDLISEEMGDLDLNVGLGFRLNMRLNRHVAEAIAHKFFRAEEDLDASGVIDDAIASGYEHNEDEERHTTRLPSHKASLMSASFKDRGVDLFSAQSGRSIGSSWNHYAKNKQHREGVNDGVLVNARMASIAWQRFWGIQELSSPWIGQYGQAKNETKLGQTSWPYHGQSVTEASEAVPYKTNPACIATGNLGSIIKDAVFDAMGTNASMSGAAVTQTSSEHQRTSGSLSRIPLQISDVQHLLRLHKGEYNYAGPRSMAVADSLAIGSAGRAHVLCVAPTGAGKSDLMLLPSSKIPTDSFKFVLAIVPFNALIADLLKSCARKKLPATNWERPDSILPHHKIVFVSLNRAVSNSMLTWLANDTNASRIERVILDEAHVLLDERSFRTCVRKVPDLIALLCNKHWTFLSATIPPRQEVALTDLLGIPLSVKRDLTHRDNIAFAIKRYTDRTSLINTVSSTVKAYLKHPDDQAMIVTKSKSDATLYASQLQCGYFFAGPDDDNPEHGGMASKHEALQSFLDGRSRIIVGTPAIAVGVNRPGVRVVVFIDAPYSMTSWSQGVGRASRDGRQGAAVLFLHKSLHVEPPPTSFPTNDADALTLMLSETICMRHAMGCWLDGRAANCFELVSDPCTYCRKLRDLPSQQVYDAQSDHTGDDNHTDTEGRSEDDNPDKTSPSPRTPAPPSQKRKYSHENTEASKRTKQRGMAPPRQFEDLTTASYQALNEMNATSCMDTPTKVTQRPIGPTDLSMSLTGDGAKECVPTTTNPPAETAPAPLTSLSALEAKIAGSVRKVPPVAPHFHQLRNQLQEKWPATSRSVPRLASAKSKTMPGYAAENDDNDDIDGPSPPLSSSKRKQIPESWPLSDDESEVSNASTADRENLRRVRPRPYPPHGQRAEQVDSFDFFTKYENSGRGMAKPDGTPGTCTDGRGSTMTLGTTALRMRSPSTAKIDALRDWSDYMRAIQDILPKTTHKCPMCATLGHDAEHTATACQREHLDMKAQIKFRRDKENEWGYGQACFFCHLPQDVCRRRNETKGCTLREHKDTIRGIIMMLTAYPEVRERALETAMLFNPQYDLPEPKGLLQMGIQWREVEWRFGSPTYKAFQAVAAVLFMWDDRI